MEEVKLSNIKKLYQGEGGRENQNAARLGSQSYSPKFKLVSVKFLYDLQKVNQGREPRQPYALVQHGKQGHHIHILQVYINTQCTSCVVARILARYSLV